MGIKLLGRSSPVIVRESVESTNTLMKELAFSGAAEGTVLLAARQSAGRGRMDRQFQSPLGGLYLSMLLTPACTPDQTLTLTPCAAVAVHRAIRELCKVEADIKWPNDLMLKGRKICGILCESVFFQSQQKLIVGVGLNVSSREEDFSPELHGIAGSLLSVTGSAPALEDMAKALVCNLDEMYADWCVDKSACLDEYRRFCISCGRQVKLIRNGESTEAFALEIDRDYALLVRYPDGRTARIKTGEVSLR